VISTITNNTDLQLEANGTGKVAFENFAFKNNTITNTATDAVTLFESTGTGYFQISGNTGVVLPIGDNATRPVGVTGMIRFNTNDKRVELYDGTTWVSVAGATAGISFIQAEDIAIEKVLIFG
jgi:transcriptional regulator of acetoin/glycerol metabolism